MSAGNSKDFCDLDTRKRLLGHLAADLPVWGIQGFLRPRHTQASSRPFGYESGGSTCVCGHRQLFITNKVQMWRSLGLRLAFMSRLSYLGCG